MKGRDRVIVVGAGPVGLTAALRLAVRDIPVTLFEAEDAINEDLRASTFHPPTLEMMDEFGLVPELIAMGIVTPTWQVRQHETSERALFDLSVLADETPYPFRLQCEQQNLSFLILERLKKYPHADIRFGQKVLAVGQDADGVRAETADDRVEGRWMIGCDGAHSVVRRHLDLPFEGESYPGTTILATTDFDFSTVLEGLSGVNYCWTRKGTFSLLRLPGLWRFSLYPPEGASIEEALRPESVEAELQELVPRSSAYNVPDIRPFRVHMRVVTEYRVGRMLLAGDAAHLNSPAGGMGMNGGIHDAVNLTGKLVEVWRGGDPALLDRYARQRRPIAIEHVLEQADRNRKRMHELDPERRRKTLADLQRTAGDPVKSKVHLLRSSMIEGLREAERIA